MPAEATSLMVDGGAAANDFLCQFQADLLGIPVQRPEIVETTALGAAFMAGLGTGVWESTDELRETWRLGREFTPVADARTEAETAYARWQKGVELAKAWSD
jgi:glycerol kinase